MPQQYKFSTSKQKCDHYHYSELDILDNNFSNSTDVSSSASNTSRRNYFFNKRRYYHYNNTCLGFKLAFIFMILFVGFFFIFTKLISLLYEEQNEFFLESSKYEKYVDHTTSNNNSDYDTQSESPFSQNWLIKGPKCHIPQIDPWHESIKGYISKSKPLDCNKYLNETENLNKALSYVENNRLYFTKEALDDDVLDKNCCYREIKRSEENDDDLNYEESCELILENGLLIPFELIRIECFNNYTRHIKWNMNKTFENLISDKVELTSAEQQGKSTLNSEQAEPLNQDYNGLNVKTRVRRKAVDKINNKLVEQSKSKKRKKSYSNVHAFIIPKQEEILVLNRALNKNLLVDQYYNVVMVGMDTISRLNAYRQLNETLSTLREKFNTIEFKGYNKIGENTFPNLIPLLTGLTPSQLVETKCWLATNYTDDNERGDEYLNDCKYLWSFYQEFGYMTYFSEDWPQASTFNYLKPGFKQEPTAYYGRPITLARQKFLTGSKNHMDCDICVLDKPVISLDLLHLKSYINFYRDRPHFAFQWINCPQHDELNGASKVDHIVREFFDSIFNSTYEDRTFVIFFSDHGWRWNDFVGTRIGHYESSLPLLTIAPPKHFIKNHPDLYEKLKSYQETLITPFDLFKTLIDIRNLGKKKTNSVDLFTNQLLTTASSLFTYGDLNNNNNNNFMMMNPMATGIIQQQLEASTSLQPSTTSNSDAIFTQIPPLNGINYNQNFRTFSLIDRNTTLTTNITQRSCIEAGIPDNYCVCNEFKEVDINSQDVIAAAYYLVYVHLDTRVLDGERICVRLNLKKINKAEKYDFSEVKKLNNRRRRETSSASRMTQVMNENIKKQLPTHTTTTPSPTIISTTEQVVDETHYLPNREYNLKIVTQPGDGIFQEVLRYYGDNIDDCKAAYLVAKDTVESASTNDAKREAVLKMNEKCKFSVHSDSISRLNLYKDQSKCVKSNIELKKVCYCKDLLKNQ